jgi:peptidyl-prolyl cis-trans isomerase SurA
MKKNIFTLFVVLLISTNFYSQKKKDILMTIDDKQVLVSEFKRVFNKNLNLVQEEEQKSVDGYLNLFIDYKLKVTEAKAQGLHETELYIKEFEKYQDQLSRNYMFDDRVTDELVREAYDRSLEEVNADHILVMIELNALPKDTLIAYNKIKTIWEKAIKNDQPFDSLVKKYSEEPAAKEHLGKLGYFSAFSMVYDFENAAFNTPVGEISDIVRTEFGYHIIKVNDRRKKKHKINVSHIMIFENDKEREYEPEKRINELYAMIQQGESFEGIARQFSEDRNTAINGGKIKTFGVGDLRAPLFEEAAYSLKEIGEVSKPIKSSFGWHIVRLNKIYPIPTFEEERKVIESKVNAGARAKIVTKAANEKIKNEYGYQEGISYMPYMYEFVSDSILKKKWEYVQVPNNENKMLFRIGDNKVTYDDFAQFIADKQKFSRKYDNKEILLIDYYKEFYNKTLKDYFKQRLEEENEEYASVLDEYRNGLLIFDVMDKNIWSVAKNDSIGLQKFFEKTKGDYVWKKRIEGDIYTSTTKSNAVMIQKLLEKGTESKDIRKQLNNGNQVNVIVNSGNYEIDRREVPKNFEEKIGISKVYEVEDSFVVMNVKNIIPSTEKDLEMVKGLVLSKYQNYLEEKWMNDLRKKHIVIINERVLKRVKKELNP